MEQWLQDFRFGFRMLLKHPGFTAAIVLTLAIGIGANSAIFSIINGLLLKPLPYPDGEQLVQINNSYPKMGLPIASVSIPDYLDRREQMDAITESALYYWTTAGISAGETPEQLYGLRTTGTLFATIGIQPMLGRGFTDEEMTPGNDKAVVITHGLWQRMFGGREDVIGETIRVDGEAHRVVGVTPPSFVFPNDKADFFLPFAFTPEDMSDAARGYEYSTMVARLAPGASIELAEQQMRQIIQRNLERIPEASDHVLRTGFTGIAQNIREEKVGELRAPLLLLQVTVGFVLLIVCANVANLMLTRVVARQKEMSIRSALGAGKLRIARQLLSESLLLALLGGLGGILLAYWIINGLQAVNLLPGNQLFDLGIDTRVLGFALGVAVGTGLLFGLFPVISIWRSNTSAVLKEGGRGNTGSRGAKLSRNTLVVSQVTMAVMLLVAAGLLMRSFIKLQSVNPGFVEEGVLTAQISLPEARYPDAAAASRFYAQLDEEVRAIPGVTGYGLTSALPFSGHSSSGSYRIAGRDIADDIAAPHGYQRLADAGYFDAMQIPLLQGRMFDSRDIEGGQRVVLVDEILVKKYFPDSNPIGAQIVRGLEDDPENHLTVIGVVGAVHSRSLKENLEKEAIYHPFSQNPRGEMTVVMRTSGQAENFVAPLREAVQRLDPELPVFDIQTMTARIDRSLRAQRAPMFLLAIFSGVALLLAAIGLYGVLAFSVTQRTGELGVRMALGAARGDVMKLVLGQGGRLIAFGLALGLIGAYVLARFMSSQLYEVKASDPAVFALVLIFLGLTGFAACLLPARRATRVDPMAALRYE